MQTDTVKNIASLQQTKILNIIGLELYNYMQ